MISFHLRFNALRQTYGRVRRRLLIARGLVAMLTLLALDAGLRLFGDGLLSSGWSLMLLPAAMIGPLILERWRQRAGSSSAVDAADLDRRFHLSELFTTAVEVDRRSRRTAVEGHLLSEAAGTAHRLNHADRLGGAALRREAQAALGLLLLSVGLGLLVLVVPLHLPERLPDLEALGTGADAGIPSGGESADGLGAGSQGAGSAAGLAAALGDQGAGREIAAALSRGRPQEAAAAARRLADQAGRLSEAGRRDLAEALRVAARALPTEQVGLKRALEDAAKAMQAPEAERGTRLGQLAAGLDALAEARGAATVMPIVPRRAVPGSGQGAAVQGGVVGGAGSASTAPGARLTRLGPAGPSTAGQPLLLPAATVLPSYDRVDWTEREWLVHGPDDQAVGP